MTVSGVIVLMLIVAAFVAYGKIKGKLLQNEPSGATRLESVKARHANMTISDYAKAGWDLIGQSSAKSLGREAKVTLTFRKR